MKLLRSESTKIVLVRQNQIPIVKIANPKYVNDLVKLYSFAAVNQLQDPGTGNFGINFNNGIYVVDGKEIAIEGLTIETRKIIIQMEGSSEDAEAFYNIVKKYLSDLVEIHQEDLLVPVIVVDETVLISELKFSPHKLFSNILYNQVSENLLARASNEISTTRLGNLALTFHLDYEPIDFPLLADNRLSLSRKEFSIQVAPGYGVNDRVFITKAPLNTNNHIEFLKDLETVLEK
ncbi:MAG: hypothetical protein JW730_15120 [Anaerolineales bacterium]|nr:hypothetical protein [Anaerolineales bacterium]